MALTLNSSGVVVVDDTSSDISYQGNWFTGGVPEEYNSTTHGSSTVGSTATFRFQGSAISVYGTVTNGTTSHYVLDNSSAVSLVGPGQDSVNDIHQNLFYTSPILQDNVHTLVICVDTNDTNEVLWLDYFVYQPSPSSSGTASSTHTGSAKGNIGVLAGAVIGGLLGGFIILVVIYVMWRLKRLRSKTNVKTDLLADDSPPIFRQPSKSELLNGFSPSILAGTSENGTHSGGTVTLAGASSSRLALMSPDQSQYYNDSVSGIVGQTPFHHRLPTVPTDVSLLLINQEPSHTLRVQNHQDAGVSLAEGPRPQGKYSPQGTFALQTAAVNTAEQSVGALDQSHDLAETGPAFINDHATNPSGESVADAYHGLKPQSPPPAYPSYVAK